MRGIAYRAHHLIASPVRNSPCASNRMADFYFVDVDPDVKAILARPVFDVESAAAHAQCGVLGRSTRTGSAPVRFRISWPLTPRFTSRMALTAIGRPALTLARLNAPANVARAYGRTAVAALALHASAAVGFARGYASLDDRRRVERIANAAPPHGAESFRLTARVKCRAILYFALARRNLIGLALQSRAMSKPRLSREPAIPGFRAKAHCGVA